MLKSTATRIMLYVVLAWFLSADYSLVTHYGHLSPVTGAIVASVMAVVSPVTLVGVMHARKTKFKLLLEPASMVVVVAAYLGFYSKFNAWESLIAGSFAMGGFLIALAEERSKAKELAKTEQDNLEYNRLLAFKRKLKESGQEDNISNLEYEMARRDESLDSEPEVVNYLRKRQLAK